MVSELSFKQENENLYAYNIIIHTRNKKPVSDAVAVKNSYSSLSTESISVDDVGAHLILDTAVALLTSNTRCHTVNEISQLRTRSYKQNSSVEFDSKLELTNQISHVTNFGFFDGSIQALSRILA